MAPPQRTGALVPIGVCERHEVGEAGASPDDACLGLVAGLRRLQRMRKGISADLPAIHGLYTA